ncbi:hypothetical protein [Candidatus Thiothrix anitrata]|jgi:hypothetical protein|uniref:NlpC/P60 domain-containing protein n=1 Tax=Candidatus Thiothrix anitrata TaxID=2823902 RepID=A0ABX7X0P2_9GAMM|nr:hypothetical protein [Candidatus Thiothrix anitrata]QTR49430.1 hypothetical protein J8380_14450 [Candidatus Thiothrix anitrata]
MMETELLIQKVLEKFRKRSDEFANSPDYPEDYYPYGDNIAQRLTPALDQYRELMISHTADLLPRLKALTWALRMYINEDYRVTYAYHLKSMGTILTKTELESSTLDPTKVRVSTYNAYDWKCNKLVADAYAVGGAVGLSIGKNLDGVKTKGNGYPAAYDCNNNTCYLWAPQANILAKQNYNLRSLTNAKPLRKTGDLMAQPEVGDIICFPSEGGLGHSSLYLGKKLIISAKESGIDIEAEEYETEGHDGKARIRKFTGSGR